MSKASERKSRRSLLARLLRDEAGNTIAIMAAAVLPTIGLIGGAVDVSRIYLAKTKLQAACDAGTLMGRKVMATGAWNTESNAQAEKMFNLNFKSGDYGTDSLTKSFTESSGNVSGVAGVNVPVTIMRPVLVPTTASQKAAELRAAFVAQYSRQPTEGEGKALDQIAKDYANNKDYGVLVQANCQSEMAIPNSDVMFVLDVTGSMAQSDGSGSSKIAGLRKATKCFYETLQKENISAVSPSDCGQATDPSGGNSADVSIRFGFVPYAVNVNVGKLLPLNYIADNWTYQSREAAFTLTAGYYAVYGNDSAFTEYGTPTTTGAQSWGSDPWDDSPDDVTVGGNVYSRKFNATQTECNNFAFPAVQSSTSTGVMQYVSQTPSTPTYPTTTSVTVNHKQVTGTTETEYRYVWSNTKKGGQCRLQLRTRSAGTTTRYYQTTRAVTWEQNRTFNGWTYKPVTHNVSGLKDTTNNAWRSSVNLRQGTDGAYKAINWDGCIEERQTVRVNDSNPSDNWYPIPAGAKDMNIDLVPNANDPTTQWGPILDDTVYERYWQGSATTNDLGPNDFGYNEGQVALSTAYCPVQARLYQQWTPSAFNSYIDSLAASGNTYHDIGLLWGARLMSPSGIFSNLTAPPDKDIQRHMIFMTDGDTNAQQSDYSAYGMHWWDRRQNDGVSAPSKTWLDSNINARTQAICSWVKAQNITLWVISFGTDIAAATQTNLDNCASPGKSYSAANSTELNDKFRSIASEISMLRLTN